MKTLRIAALGLVLGVAPLAAQAAPATPASAKKEAAAAHKEAKAAEKMADKAADKAAEAKHDAMKANAVSHMAMGDSAGMKKGHMKSKARRGAKHAKKAMKHDDMKDGAMGGMTHGDTVSGMAHSGGSMGKEHGAAVKAAASSKAQGSKKP